MDKVELKEIIDNNTEYFGDGEYNVYYDVILDKIRYKILKEVEDKLWGGLVADLEHGTKSLNTLYSTKFYSEYKYLAKELTNLSSEIEKLEETND